jgi:hypothetical protein
MAREEGGEPMDRVRDLETELVRMNEHLRLAEYHFDRLARAEEQLQAQVARLSREREAARQVIKDGLVAYGMQRGEILRAWVRRAATFLDTQPEGQGDG